MMLTDEARRLAEVMRSKYGYSPLINMRAAQMLERMAEELERANTEKDAAPVVHGRWIHCAGKSNLWHCSECGGRIMYNQTRKTYNIKKLPVSEANKFCKHCGAKMDAEENEGGGETD